jgi:putative DNA methylase
MVNDPGYERHLGRGVNKKDAQIERERLFTIIRKLVLWENTNNEEVLAEARVEIWKSWRETCALNKSHPDTATLFNPEKLPAFHDPFAGARLSHKNLTCFSIDSRVETESAKLSMAA